MKSLLLGLIISVAFNLGFYGVQYPRFLENFASLLGQAVGSTVFMLGVSSLILGVLSLVFKNKFTGKTFFRDLSYLLVFLVSMRLISRLV